MRRLHPLAWLLPSALLLRLAMFAGRGDYVAFDEGWYLLLGRNLLAGEGFSLAGLRHVTLSPLFPILAGAVDAVLGNAIWSGRLVAAVAAALLVVPCWSIFRRLASQRTATLACAFVMAVPALAPFVVPYWVGRDLWVGAEPLLHLFLFSAIALVLRARESGRLLEWMAAGVAFALAYLARPEAIIVLGATGLLLGAAALYARRPAGLVQAAVLAFAFAATAAPYWTYLHDVLGRWTITGRGVPVSVRAAGSVSGAAAPAEAGPTATIEQMLWHGDASTYVQRLYALDASRTRLASDYWGVPRIALTAGGGEREGGGTAGVAADGGTAGEATAGGGAAGEGAVPAGAAAAAPSRLVLYGRALGVALPWYAWPVVLLGAGVARRRQQRPARRVFNEVLVAAPLLFTSVMIARVVAIDPRTQLVLLPLAAFYLARGLRFCALELRRRTRGAGVRPAFARTALVTVMLALLFGTQARWLYMSLAVGSPHHLAGESNRAIGHALAAHVPADGTVMSWHPAVALYARRDWRVLPRANIEDIVRYSAHARSEYIVLSRFYPGPELSPELAERHVVLHVPAVPEDNAWRLHFTPGDGPFLLGELLPDARAAGLAAAPADLEG